MKAVVLEDFDIENVLVKEVDAPRPAAREILVKVAVAGQNPADCAMAGTMTGVKPFGKPGSILGNDYSGVVAELGEGAEKHGFKVGDRVAGAIWGGLNPGYGAWAEYLIADPKKLLKLPESVSLEDGSTLFVCAATALQMMWETLQLYYTPQSPSSSREWVLIWGGSTIVGWFAIQFAALSGLRVVATTSPKHHDAVKALGAEVVFDYRDPDVVKKIRDLTGGQITRAWDCNSRQGSPLLVADAMSEQGGIMAVAQPPLQGIRPEITAKFSLSYSFFEENPEIKLASKDFLEFMPKIMQAGQLKFPPVRTFGPGFNGIREGFEYNNAGKISGERVAYVVGDTP